MPPLPEVAEPEPDEPVVVDPEAVPPVVLPPLVVLPLSCRRCSPHHYSKWMKGRQDRLDALVMASWKSGKNAKKDNR